MIVRNEESNLRPCLEPVVSLFDEVVVVDTGSTDATRTVAADLGVRLFECPWRDDFAAARNESLALARGDWVFWLDADDRLDAANLRRLRELFATLGAAPHAYMMNTLCVPQIAADATVVIPHCRLFRRLPGVRWERRVHEQILPSLERHGQRVVHTDVEIRHLGYQDPVLFQRKNNRDLRLLRLEYAADPADSATLFNLGLTYMRLGNYADALTHLLSSLKFVPPQADWARRLYAALCETLTNLGRYREALALTTEGLRRCPDDPVLLTRCATLLQQSGDLGEAERCLLRVARGATKPHGLVGDQRVLDGQEARFVLGLVYQDQGRLDDSERVFQELLAAHPAYAEAWVGLSYVYLAQRRFADLEYVARQLEKCENGGLYARILRAQGHLVRGEMAAARALLDHVITCAPRMVWPRIVLGDWLLRSGADRDACITAQRDVLRLDPGNYNARRHLERLLSSPHNTPATTPLWFSLTI
jgi:tetratricopeptide (TPR) repeat protein